MFSCYLSTRTVNQNNQFLVIKCYLMDIFTVCLRGWSGFIKLENDPYFDNEANSRSKVSVNL